MRKIHPLDNAAVDLFAFESALRVIADGYKSHDCELIDQEHVGELLTHMLHWLNEITQTIVKESGGSDD